MYVTGIYVVSFQDSRADWFGEKSVCADRKKFCPLGGLSDFYGFSFFIMSPIKLKLWRWRKHVSFDLLIVYYWSILWNCILWKWIIVNICRYTEKSRTGFIICVQKSIGFPKNESMQISPISQNGGVKRAKHSKAYEKIRFYQIKHYIFSKIENWRSRFDRVTNKKQICFILNFPLCDAFRSSLHGPS